MNKTLQIEKEVSDYTSFINSIENPNFEKIRRYCNNLLEDNQADDMQKYLAENGKMHKALIYDSLEQFISQLNGKNLTLVEWGCEQGIASMLVLDYIREKQLDIEVSTVILIDDDSKVLCRAMAQVEVLTQNITPIQSIKSNDKTVISDTFLMNSKNTTLHLFVNDKFPIYLAEIDWNVSERAYFICISNNNSKIIDKVYEKIRTKHNTHELSKRSDKIGRFQRFENIFYLIHNDYVSQKQNELIDAIRNISFTNEENNVIQENQKVSEQSIAEKIESLFMNIILFIGFIFILYILYNVFTKNEQKEETPNENIKISEEYTKQDENLLKTQETIQNHQPKVNNPITDLKVLIQEHIAKIDWAMIDDAEYIEFKNDLAEIIIYTVFAGGGGNHYEQFMIAKIDNIIYQPISIGGKGVFMADTIRFEGTEIIINGMANKEDDAWGFPTLPYTKRFAIKNSIMSEQ